MHDTNCCSIRWSVEVAFCEKRGVWRAVAHDSPAFSDDDLTELLQDECFIASRSIDPPHDEHRPWFAVATEGETAAAAVAAAVQQYEHERATLEFNHRVERLCADSQWRSMPAPRRTQEWRRVYDD